MSKQFWLMVSFNVLIGIVFLLFNVHLWTAYGVITMDAFAIVAHSKMDAAFWTEIPNLLFWLFWIAVVGNLAFVALILRKQHLEGTKENS